MKYFHESPKDARDGKDENTEKDGANRLSIFIIKFQK